MLRLVRDEPVGLEGAPDDDAAEYVDEMEVEELQEDGTERPADELPADPQQHEATCHQDAPAEAPDGAVEDDLAESPGSDTGDLPAEKFGVLEALLLSTHHPLTAGRLSELLDLPSTKPVRRAIKDLNAQYESSGRTFRIEQVAGGFQILTLPEFGEHLKKLHQREADAKLTKAALETLAIVAYKQPILRADVEAIRGVACGETIRSLMEKRLVKIAGRAELPGRPILYGTTKRFLELFGLNTLRDLPQPDALKPREELQG